MTPSGIPFGPFLDSRESAKAAGETHYYSAAACQHGHRVVRTVSEGKCDECRRASWMKVRRRMGHKPFVSNTERANAKRKGQSKFGGKPCPHGHSGERWTHNNLCVQCSDLASRKFNKSNGYKHQAEWARNNKDKVAVLKRRYRITEKGVIASRKDGQARRARKNKAGGTHTASDVSALLLMQGRKCAFCKCNLRARQWHVDHIISLSRGGTNDKYNLQILCPPCNLKKWTTDPIKFAQKHGRLL